MPNPRGTNGKPKKSFSAVKKDAKNKKKNYDFSKLDLGAAKERYQVNSFNDSYSKLLYNRNSIASDLNRGGTISAGRIADYKDSYNAARGYSSDSFLSKYFSEDEIKKYNKGMKQLKKTGWMDSANLYNKGKMASDMLNDVRLAAKNGEAISDEQLEQSKAAIKNYGDYLKQNKSNIEKEYGSDTYKSLLSDYAAMKKNPALAYQSKQQATDTDAELRVQQKNASRDKRQSFLGMLGNSAAYASAAAQGNTAQSQAIADNIAQSGAAYSDAANRLYGIQQKRAAQFDEKQQQNIAIINSDARLKALVDKAYKEDQRNEQRAEEIAKRDAKPDAYSNPAEAFVSAHNEAQKMQRLNPDFENTYREQIAQLGYNPSELIEAYRLQMEAEDAERFKGEVAELTQKAPYLAIPARIAAQSLQMQAVPEIIASGVQEMVTGEYRPLDINSKYFVATQFRDNVDETVKNEIDNDSLKGKKIRNFLYQTGMSMGDFASTAALGAIHSAVPLFIMGTSAGVQAAKDATERGLDATHAMFTGLAAGAAEVIFEKFSLENLKALAATGKKGMLNRVKDILKQSFTEGSEEFFTDIANALTDQLINGNQSELAQQYQELKKSGLTKKDALTQVAKNFGLQLAESFAGGALSGGVMGGGAVAVNSAQSAQMGKAIKSGDLNVTDLPTLINVANSLGEGSKAYQMLEKTITNNKNASDAQIGALFNETYQEVADIIDNATTYEELAKATDIIDAISRSNPDDNINDAFSRSVLAAYGNKAEAIAMGELKNATLKTTEDTVEIKQAIKEETKAVKETEAPSEKKGGVNVAFKIEAPTDSGNAQLISVADSNSKAIVFNTASGSEISTSDMYLQSMGKQGAIISSALGEIKLNDERSMPMGIKGTEQFISSMDSIDFNTDTEFTHAASVFKLAYLNGLSRNEAEGIGVTWAQFKAQNESSFNSLDEADIKAMYEAGVTDARIETEVKDKKGNIERNKSTLKRTGKRGTVTGEADEGVKFLEELIANATGADIANEDTDGTASAQHQAAKDLITLFNLNAKEDRGEAFALVHEQLERVKAGNPELYREIARTILEFAIDNTSTTTVARAAANYRAEYLKSSEFTSFLEANQEIVNDCCAALICGNETAQKAYAKWLSEHCDKSLIEKIKDVIQKIVDALNEFLNKANLNAIEMKFVEADAESAQRMVDLILKGMDSVSYESTKEMQEHMEAFPNSAATQTEKTIRENFTTDQAIADGSTVHFNQATIDIGLMQTFLDEQSTIDDSQKEAIIKYLTEIKEMTGFEEYEEWMLWQNTLPTVVEDENGKLKFVDNWIVKNGEYALNNDATTLCKKRMTFDRILSKLYDKYGNNYENLTKEDFAIIKQIIRDAGFEVACDNCFVDAKRYRVLEWAASFTNTWNALVDSLVEGTEYFAGYQSLIDGKEELSPNNALQKLTKEQRQNLNFKKIDEILDGYAKRKAENKNTSATAIERYANDLKANVLNGDGKMAVKLRAGQLTFSDALTNLKKTNGKLFNEVNSHQGSAKPKLSLKLQVYHNEVLDNGKFTREAAYAVGGVRLQSFSDYIASMFVDYCQLIADYAAKGLPAHAYTKEILFAKLFGMTGMKINLSLMPALTAKDIKWINEHMELDNDDKLVVKEKYKSQKSEIEARYKAIQENAGLDENGNYIWARETVGYAEAKAALEKEGKTPTEDEILQKAFDMAIDLQNTEGYSSYVGTILVGISDAHIRKALRDKNIRMVIPYHKSSINPAVALLTGIIGNTDYTNQQNTRYTTADGTLAKVTTKSFGEKEAKAWLAKQGITPQSFRAQAESELLEERNGKAPTEKMLDARMKKLYNAEVRAKASEQYYKEITDENGNDIRAFDDYEWLAANPDADAKDAARAYLDHCEQYGLTPKFEQFADEENYYKLLEDFNSFDCITEANARQEDVRMVLPDNYQELLKESLEEQQETSKRLDKTESKIIDDISNRIFASITKAEDIAKAPSVNVEAKGKYNIPNALMAEDNNVDSSDVRFSKKVDVGSETEDFLENQEHVKVYRAMQYIDGKLYPPMAAIVDGKKNEGVDFGQWEESEERPDLIKFDDKGRPYFELKKGNGKTIKARYNPYFHTSLSPLNDQFTSAYERPNLVVVEGEVPSSELTSGYKAQYAKDTVGETKWHSGVVSSKLKGDKARRVILSRWFKPLRVVPDAEVAKVIAKTLEGENIEVPYNVVTPSLKDELEKQGVKIKYSNPVDIGIQKETNQGQFEFGDFVDESNVNTGSNTNEEKEKWLSKQTDVNDELLKIAKEYRENGGWYDRWYVDLRRKLNEYPQQDYIVRIKNGDNSARQDFAELLKKVDNVDDMWVVVRALQSLRSLSDYRGARRVIDNIGKKRAEELGGGRNIGFEERNYTPKEIHEIFNELNTNPEVQALGDKVFAVLDEYKKDVTIQGVKSIKDAEGNYISDAMGIQSSGVIQYKIPDFNSAAYSDQYKATALLHEAIHFFTAYAIHCCEKYPNKINDEQRAAAQIIIDSYRQLRKKYDSEDYYGMTNAHEFVAELADVKFREMLKKESVWEKIKNAILRLFGVVDQDDKSALTTTTEALEILLDEYLYGVYDRIYGRGRSGLDIKHYSQRVDIGDESALIKENAELKEALDYYKMMYKGNSGHIVSRKKIRDIAIRLKREWGGKISTDELANKIADMYDYISSGKATWELVEQKGLQAVNDMLDSEPKVINAENQHILKLMKEIAPNGISLTDEQRRTVEDVYDSMRTWISNLNGGVNYRTNGMSLVDFWNEMQKVNPTRFNYNVDESEMPIVLAEYTKALNEEYSDTARDRYEEGEAEQLILMDLWDSYFELPEVVTPVDRANKKLMAEKVKNKERLAKVKQRYKKRYDEQLKYRLDKYKDTTREKKIRREAKEKITRLKRNLDRMLLNPTDKMYVPQNLVKEVIKVCDMLSEAERYWKNGNPKQEATQLRLDALQRRYADLAKDEELKDEYDEDFNDIVKALADKLNDKQLSELSPYEMEDVYQALKTIYDTIRDATVQLGKEERISNYQLAVKAMEQTLDTEGAATRGGELLNGYESFVLNPMRYVRKVAEYSEDSVLLQLTEDVEQGVFNKNRWYAKAMKPFLELRNGKNEKTFDDFVTVEKDYGIKDKDGNPVLMTEAQALQLYMTATREEGFNHLQNGGAIIADTKLQNEGKNKEAKQKGKSVAKGQGEQILKIGSQLSDYGKKWMAASRYLFDTLAKEAINKTSMVLKHRKLATGNNYIHLEVNGSEINKELEGLVRDATLEGSGNLKSTAKNAGQGVVIRGMSDVVDNQIDFVSKYANLAIPIRNFNKVYNGKASKYFNPELVDSKGSQLTVKSAIEQKWGRKGLETIESFIEDLQSPRAKGEKASNFLAQGAGALRSAFVVATLAGNIQVAIKQAASYPTAAAVLSWNSLLKGLGGFVGGQKLWNEIDEHTGMHFIRREGYTDTEIGDITASKSKLAKAMKKIPTAINPMKWIQGIDVATTAALWNASKAEIEATTDYTKGSDAYWKAVTDLYEKVITETQPNYDVMHRPEVQKQTNEIVKAAVMFKTQPLQNTGILYNAAGELRQMEKNYKADSSEANKKALDAAKKKFGMAVISQTVSMLTFVAMTLLGQALSHRMFGFRDDDDEVTLKSVTGGFLHKIIEYIITDILPIGSGTAIAAYNKFVEGSTFEAVSVPSTQTINDFLDYSNKVIKAIGDVSDKDVKVGENAKLIFAIANLLTKAIDICGLPASNTYKSAKGLVYYAIDAAKDENKIFETSDKDFTDPIATKKKKMFRYADEGNFGEAERLRKDVVELMKSEGKDDKYIADRIKSDISRRYKQAYINGDGNTRGRIVSYMTSTGLYGSRNDVNEYIRKHWKKD